MRTIAAILVAAVAGWVVRDVTFVEEAAPVARVGPAGQAEARPAFSPVAERVARVEMPHASVGDRNLFAYRERAAAPVRFEVVNEAPAVVAVAPVSEPVRIEAAEEQPRFGYRFIGTFGTRERRLAAFTRDGEVIAVRAGAKIGADFVLRSIGIESVEVQPVSAPALPQRIAIGQ
ncbi:MAG TPA: hypothetical protein VF266_05755 [Thermoanaerobaculia bacterium]